MPRGSIGRVIGVSVFALLSAGGVAGAQTVQQWPHDQTNAVVIATFIDTLGGSPGKPSLQPTTAVLVPGFAAQAVFGTNKVTLGPFLAVNNGKENSFGVPGAGTAGSNPIGSGVTQTYVVSVLARTPLGTNPSPIMTEIGHAQVTVPSGSQTSFFVTATLPAILSAIDVQVAVPFVPGGAVLAQKSVLSPDCATLTDATCMQAGINPIGMLSGLAPITILYEPPGSCSFAQFTSNSLQGTTVAVDDVSAANTGTLTTTADLSGNTTIDNLTTSHSNDNSKSNQVQMTAGLTVSTLQGGSSPPANCAARTTGGPGHGDTFEILDNGPMVYWDTNNLSNSRFRVAGEPIPPGQLAPALIAVTADQLQGSPAALPGTLSLHPQSDLTAILGVDPLVALAASGSSTAAATVVPFMPLPLPRYAPLSLHPEIGVNIPVSFTAGTTDTAISATVIKSAVDDVNSTMGPAGGSDVETNLAVSGIKTALTSSLSIVGSKVTASGGAGGFQVFTGVVSGFLTQLFNSQPTVKTTIETTLTKSNTLSTVTGGGDVQTVFLRDPNHSLNAQFYWDQLFGTIAVQEVPAAMGTLALSAQAAAAIAMKPLAHVAWIKTVVTGQDSSAAFPQSIAEQLSAVAGGGSFTLVPVAANSFQVSNGFVSGLPAGVTVAVTGLAGTTSATPAVYQQAFFIVDSNGNQDGVFWQTIAIAASTASVNGMCSSEPNNATPGTEIVTCCSLAGICDSFVAPATGSTVHLEAESNVGHSQTTASATEVAANADGAYIKFSSVNFGPIASLITGFRARALPSAIGQSLELWVDSPGSSGGGTLLGTLAFDGPIQNCAGSWADRHQTRDAIVSGAPSGVHDVYVVFRGPPGDSLDWIELSFEAQAPMGPRVQYRPGDVGQVSDNQIEPWITIANDGNTDMKLNNLLVRYWYTIDSGAPQTVNVDYASFGAQNVSGTFVGLSVPMKEADQTLNVSFPAATCFVPPGTASGEIHLRINKTDFSNYNENNDYSYVPGLTGYADNMAITAYVGGQLAWGMEPAAVAGAEAASSGLNFHVQYKVGDPGQSSDNAIKPQFVIFNDNTVSVPLNQLTVRYWFTAETTAASQFWCDYAMIGNNNVSGNVAGLASPRPGANRYMQVSFSSGAGSLFPLGSTGQIQTRVSQVDWSNFNEADDYSYNPNDTSFMNWDHVTLYRNGTLVWGTEP